MDLWPAIDVRGGRCVRLVQGDFHQETVYGDPVEVAQGYVAAGAERLHVVDLDAARTGVGANRDVIKAIAEQVDVPVQAGGGVRDEASAEALFSLGAARVVLGTLAVSEPALLGRLAACWPRRVVAGLDYRRNNEGEPEVAIRGWTEGSGRFLADVVGDLSDFELAGIAVTDISRDGTGDGPDLAGLAAVLSLTTHAVVASGGVACAHDLERLRDVRIGGRGLEGVIVGRALLSGGLPLAVALAACQPGTGRQAG